MLIGITKFLLRLVICELAILNWLTSHLDFSHLHKIEEIYVVFVAYDSFLTLKEKNKKGGTTQPEISGFLSESHSLKNQMKKLFSDNYNYHNWDLFFDKFLRINMQALSQVYIEVHYYFPFSKI